MSELKYCHFLEERWAVEGWSDLFSDFGITQPDVSDLLEVLDEAAMDVFTFVCERYAIFSFESPPKDPRPPQSIQDMVQSGGKSRKELGALQEAAISAWRTHCANIEINQRKVQQQEEEEALEYLKKGAPEMAPEYIEKILTFYDLDHVADGTERKIIARRCLQFQKHLDDVDLRAGILSIIDMESSLRELSKLKSQGTSKERLAVIAAHADLTKDLQRQLKELGIHDVDRVKAKEESAITIGEIVSGIQTFYSDPANIQVDGMHTLEEINFLLEPKPGRASQYRPDLASYWELATRPENLWNPEWSSPGFTQKECKIFRKFLDSLEVSGEDPDLLELDAATLQDDEAPALESLIPSPNLEPNLVGVETSTPDQSSDSGWVL